MNLFCIRKKKSTREEIGTEYIYENGVETCKNDYIIYFLIQPVNVAVLSEGTVRTKVMALSAVIKGFDGVEFSCINSRENFDVNKNFYKKRLEEEKSSQVRELLKKDLTHLDRVQIQTASAREFLIMVRLKNYNSETNDVQAVISRIEKILKDEGFSSKIAGKEDIKRLFAVYFVENITQVYFDDYDGEPWVKGENYS